MILDTEKAHGLVRGLGLCLQSEQDNNPAFFTEIIAKKWEFTLNCVTI